MLLRTPPRCTGNPCRSRRWRRLGPGPSAPQPPGARRCTGWCALFFQFGLVIIAQGGVRSAGPMVEGRAVDAKLSGYLRDRSPGFPNEGDRVSFELVAVDAAPCPCHVQILLDPRQGRSVRLQGGGSIGLVIQPRVDTSNGQIRASESGRSSRSSTGVVSTFSDSAASGSGRDAEPLHTELRPPTRRLRYLGPRPLEPRTLSAKLTVN